MSTQQHTGLKPVDGDTIDPAWLAAMSWLLEVAVVSPANLVTELLQTTQTLLGCEFAAYFELVASNGADSDKPVFRVNHLVIDGFSPEDHAVVLAFQQRVGTDFDPLGVTMCRLRDLKTCRRVDLIDDARWEATPYVSDLRRTLGLGDEMMSTDRYDREHLIGLTLNRRHNATMFTVAERERFNLLHRTVAPALRKLALKRDLEAEQRAAQPLASATDVCRQRAIDAGLTDRQTGIMVLLAQGYNEDEIAESSEISRNTVHSHIRALMKRFAVSKRTELVARVMAGHLPLPRRGGRQVYAAIAERQAHSSDELPLAGPLPPGQLNRALATALGQAVPSLKDETPIALDKSLDKCKQPIANTTNGHASQRKPSPSLAEPSAASGSSRHPPMRSERKDSTAGARAANPTRRKPTRSTAKPGTKRRS